MFVMGLTVAGENAIFETELQEFSGDQAQRVVKEHQLEMQNRKSLAALAYKNFAGPETRYYENLQLGVLAVYLVRRGLEDRDEQARKAGELANNSMSAAIVNECVELTLHSSEHLTIAALQKRGIRIVDEESEKGLIDPTYDGIITSELNPVDYLSRTDEPEATVIRLPIRSMGLDGLSLGVV